MPGARISFTCNTSDDIDLIEWLDSFGVRERGFIIKAALREYMTRETDLTEQHDLTDLTGIEETLSTILHEIVALRKSGLAQSINNDIINNDLSDQGELNPAAKSNLRRLLDD